MGVWGLVGINSCTVAAQTVEALVGRVWWWGRGVILGL